MQPIHPFGALLGTLRARQPGLTQARLAALAGYDPAVIARMAQGRQDLTGPQARERVLRLIQALDAAGVLNGAEEANALLAAATLPPLFAGNYVEAELIQQLTIHRRNEFEGSLIASFAPRHNLPAQPTRFIGREQELAQIRQFLAPPPAPPPLNHSRPTVRPAARLITLTGPGGVGKTRLALEVALAVCADPLTSSGQAFADGAWWVPLASLQDPSRVAQTLADTFQLRTYTSDSDSSTSRSTSTNPSHDSAIEGSDSRSRVSPALNQQVEAAPLRALVHYLENRRLLLVLDNCEHLIDACAELAAHLMRTCPHLRILATSREALQVPGEVTLRVPPLTTPRPALFQEASPADKTSLMDYDAVQLFVERAQALQPGFALTEANTPAVVHVCDRLDGIPLALELAAALLQVLSVEEIAARIDHRFVLLKGGYRAVTPRHQALSNSVDWSYELLTPAEQLLLARLSVFAGGWNAETAEEVCADPDGKLKREAVLPTLRQLVNKSLVVMEDNPSEFSRYRRYRLLRTIHEYAADKLRERNEHMLMKDSHLTYLVNVAEAADAASTTPAHEPAREQLTAQRDEWRAALAHAEASGNTEALLRLTAALQSFWRGGYREEGTQWMNRALAHSAAAPARLRLAVLFAWAWTFPNEAAHLAKHAAMMEACLEECRAAQDHIGIAQALTLLSDLARAVHDNFAQARTYLEAAWPIFETSGDRRAIHIVRHKMGVVLKQLDGAAAEAWMQASVNLYSAAGDHLYLSTTLADLAWLIEDQNPKNARRVGLWRRSVEAARAFGSSGLQAEFSLNLGNAELSAGDRTQAAEHFGQALELTCTTDSDTDDKAGIYWSLVALCKVDGTRAEAIIKRYVLNKQQLAERRGIAAGTYFLGIVLQEAEPHDFEQARQRFEQSLLMWRELGVLITRYGYGGVTRNLLALGQVYHCLGDDPRAIACFDESIRLCHEFNHAEFIAALYLARGYARLQLGELELVSADFRWACNHASQGQPTEIAMAIAALGEVAWLHGQPTLSATLSGCAATLETDIHEASYSERMDYERLIAAARQRLGDPAYAAAWAEGQILTLAEATTRLENSFDGGLSEHG